MSLFKNWSLIIFYFLYLLLFQFASYFTNMFFCCIISLVFYDDYFLFLFWSASGVVIRLVLTFFIASFFRRLSAMQSSSGQFHYNLIFLSPFSSLSLLSILLILPRSCNYTFLIIFTSFHCDTSGSHFFTFWWAYPFMTSIFLFSYSYFLFNLYFSFRTLLKSILRGSSIWHALWLALRALGRPQGDGLLQKIK